MKDDACAYACTACGEVKPIDDFGWYDRRNGRRRRQCRSCHISRGRQWKERNPDKVRAHKRAELDRNRERYLEYSRSEATRERVFNWKLENQFGITQDEFWEMFERQGGVCAICRKPPDVFRGKPRRLYVDHDHKTGVVRGLLCYRCNTGLGCFKDRIGSLKKAVQYLVSAKEASRGRSKT